MPFNEGDVVQESSRFQSKRSRTILGLAVVGVSLVVSASLAGIGFARVSSTSAEQYQYGKVTVCHKTGSKKHPHQTITISQNALKAHLKHGDTLGACPTTAPPQNGKDKGKGDAKPGDQGKGKSNDNGTPTTTTPTTPTQTTPTNGDDNKGKGNNGNNGNGNNGNTGNGNNGNGKGHGK
jgi:hypothetical protein